ncbi:GNAT family N-acetyltransferase [Kitasatospora sp. McL0602]|uniref:GNAT family N-acetyltransferase n=1 Tax=Kitasatospora sp. McL0602 TaxID=3439530 RepID=UPI003F886180
MTTDLPVTATTTAAALFSTTVPGFGTVRIRALDPAGDAELLHGWVNEQRACFWGMIGHTREQIADVYAFVDSLTTHHAYLMLRDGRPAALFQTYQPEHDPLGEHYPVREGDLGIHLLIGPAGGAPRAGHTEVLVGAFLGFLLADPAVRRIVAEPDIRNERSIARLLRTGFELGPEIELPEKRARLVFLARETAERAHRAIGAC